MLDGGVYVGEVGTTEPTDPADTPGVGWSDLGHVTTDGVAFTLSREITDIDSVWEEDPIRKLVTRVPKTLTFTLEQLNFETFEFGFGGGSITVLGGGLFQYDPPAASELDERAMIWQIIDGTKNYMLMFRRGLVTGTASVTGVRNNAALMPVEYSVLTPTSGSSFILLTDDPAFGS
jgi:hypothetical protein